MRAACDIIGDFQLILLLLAGFLYLKCPAFVLLSFPVWICVNGQSLGYLVQGISYSIRPPTQSHWPLCHYHDSYLRSFIRPQGCQFSFFLAKSTTLVTFCVKSNLFLVLLESFLVLWRLL